MNSIFCLGEQLFEPRILVIEPLPGGTSESGGGDIGIQSKPSRQQITKPLVCDFDCHAVDLGATVESTQRLHEFKRREPRRLAERTNGNTPARESKDNCKKDDAALQQAIGYRRIA